MLKEYLQLLEKAQGFGISKFDSPRFLLGATLRTASLVLSYNSTLSGVIGLSSLIIKSLVTAEPPRTSVKLENPREWTPGERNFKDGSRRASRASLRHSTGGSESVKQSDVRKTDTYS